MSTNPNTHWWGHLHQTCRCAHGWMSRGIPAALDITVTSPLTPAILGTHYSSWNLGPLEWSLRDSELHQPLGMAYLDSISCGDLWQLGQKVCDTISRLTSHLAIGKSSPKPVESYPLIIMHARHVCALTKGRRVLISLVSTTCMYPMAG